LVIAILVGGAFALTGWQLPVSLTRSIDVLAQAAGGAALFAIGGGLVGLQIKGLRRKVAWIVGAKLLLHPLATALLAYVLLPIEDPALRAAAVLSTAMPMLGVYPLLASRVGEEDLASAGLLATTVFAFVTLSVVLLILPIPR
jgi:predicted permease